MSQEAYLDDLEWFFYIIVCMGCKKLCKGRTPVYNATEATHLPEVESYKGPVEIDGIWPLRVRKVYGIVYRLRV